MGMQLLVGWLLLWCDHGYCSDGVCCHVEDIADGELLVCLLRHDCWAGWSCCCLLFNAVPACLLIGEELDDATNDNLITCYSSTQSLFSGAYLEVVGRLAIIVKENAWKNIQVKIPKKICYNHK